MSQTLFDPVAEPFDPTNRYSRYMRLPLNAHPFMWLQRGYAKDEHGHTRFVYSEEPAPRMVPIAGHKDTTTYLLIGVCRQVAKAALCSTDDVCLDWQYVADWLQAGARPALICEAIRRQIRQMGDRYDGCRSLKLFNRAVCDALARERAG